jgi:deoxycytidylate deaminase
MPRVKHSVDVFDRASQVARKSTMLHRHGAIIVHDGEIVAEGYNHLALYMEHAYSIHAEVDALTKIKTRGKKFLEECTLIVVRIGTDKMNNPFKDSKPCESCQRAIKNYGIRRVFYSVTASE